MAIPWFGFPGLNKATYADTVKYGRRRSDRPVTLEQVKKLPDYP
jgi:hypothetical protein